MSELIIQLLKQMIIASAQIIIKWFLINCIIHICISQTFLKRYHANCLCMYLLVIMCVLSWTGDFKVILYEKSCVIPALCGITGEKYALGLNFTFTNDCCDTLLCNGISTSSAYIWSSTLLSLLLALLYSQ